AIALRIHFIRQNMNIHKNQKANLLNTFAQDFTELLKDRSLYDLKIILPNGKTILGHKFCLMARSAKFRKFFQESNVINTETTQKMEEILLEKIVGTTFLSSQAVSRAFEVLFFYFYHDTLNIGNWDVIMASRENIVAFIQLVRIFEMRHLVKPTLEKIEAHLSADNAVNLLNEIMKLIDCNPLIDDEENGLKNFYDETAHKCIKYLDNKNALLEKNFSAFNMKNLSLISLNYLLKKIYSKNNIARNNQETKKFLLIVNWFNSNKSETAAKTRGNLFQNIEFSLIPAVTLATKIYDIKAISPEKYQDALTDIVIQLANKYEKLKPSANPSEFVYEVCASNEMANNCEKQESSAQQNVECFSVNEKSYTTEQVSYHHEDVCTIKEAEPPHKNQENRSYRRY
ncbi:249_t:CDS:2, partial [Ambispora leptoticha]